MKALARQAEVSSGRARQGAQVRGSRRSRRCESERDRLQTRLKAKQADFLRVKAQLDAMRGGPNRPDGQMAVPGPNGMVFPVVGSYYYSNTWGASRSGGRRRHQGTDIMAPRGTPVVAILSGSVSSKQQRPRRQDASGCHGEQRLAVLLRAPRRVGGPLRAASRPVRSSATSARPATPPAARLTSTSRSTPAAAPRSTRTPTCGRWSSADRSRGSS